MSKLWRPLGFNGPLAVEFSVKAWGIGAGAEYQTRWRPSGVLFFLVIGPFAATWDWRFRTTEGET